MIAANIANADTPRYAARDFDFRAALAEATGAPAESGGRAAAVSTTHAAHLGAEGRTTSSAGSGVAGSGVRIEATALKYRVSEQPSLDGNSVDLDRERANFADNATRYEAGLRFINGSVRTMLSAIRGE